jgi:hypothetical protein
VRVEERLDCLDAGGKCGHPLDAAEHGAVRREATDEEADCLRVAHRQDLEAVGLERDVVAEPAGLLCGVGMAVAVHEESEVIGGLAVVVVGAYEVGHPQRDHGLAQTVIHRLS